MFQTGGGFPIWTCPSFFVLFCPFWDFPDFSGIFPICSGMVRGFSRFVLFLFLGLLRAPTRNSPERVRATIWTFPEKSGKHPGLETPRFIRSEKLQNESSSNFLNFRPEFCPEFCSEFSPNFSRSFRASFRGKRRPEKIHQKSPPFFNAKFPGKHEKKIHKILLESRQSNGLASFKEDPEAEVLRDLEVTPEAS